MPRDHPLRRRPGERRRAVSAPRGRRRGPDRRSICAMPAPREVHRRSTQVLSAAMLLLGVAMIVRAVTARRRRARRRGRASARCSSPRGSGGCGWRGATADVPPHARPARPLRDHLHRRRRGAVLLARRRRAARAGADAGRLPRRRAVLPPGGDDVRRGRVAAPGPRRRDGLRPLRVQRARELHRRLGDGARLRDPAVGHGVHGDALPGRVLGADRPRGARERRRARDPRLGRVAEHPRLRADPRAAHRGARRRRHRPAGRGRRRRARRLLPAGPHHRLDPPRRDADLGQRDLRRRRRDRRLHRARVGVRPVGRAAGRAARPRAPDRVGDDLGPRPLRRRGRGRDVGAPGRRERDLAGAQLPQRPDGRRRRGVPPALVQRPAEVHDRRRRDRDADRRGRVGDARASRGCPTRCRRTARSRARSGACTRGAARRTS